MLAVGCVNRMVADLRDGNFQHKYGGKDHVGQVGIFWHFLCGAGYVYFHHALQWSWQLVDSCTNSIACNHCRSSFIFALTNEWHHQIWSTIQFTNGLPFGPLDISHGTVFFFLVIFNMFCSRCNSIIFSNCNTCAKSVSKPIAHHACRDDVSVARKFYVYYRLESISIPRSNPYCADTNKFIPLH